MENKSSRRINVTRSSMPGFDEYCAEIRELWDSCWITNMGAKHMQLEKELKAYLDVDQLQLFSNGHLALEGVMRAMKLKGEVITTPFTFASTANAIVRCGLKPVFCDINEYDFTLSPESAEKLITPNTSAIVAVHVYGNICENDALEDIAQRHGLKLIYDAAHAFGVGAGRVPVARMGDASMFSFHATKVFHTIEGGAVAFRDEQLAHDLRLEKNFGLEDDGDVSVAGGNAKLNEFQAAMGLCNLRRVKADIAERGRVAQRYIDRLCHIEGLRCWQPQPEYEPNYAYFPVFIDERKFGMGRDEVLARLAQEEIYTRKYFYPPINETGYYAALSGAPTPVAHRVARQVLALPMYAGLSDEDVDRICGLIAKTSKSSACR